MVGLDYKCLMAQINSTRHLTDNVCKINFITKVKNKK